MQTDENCRARLRNGWRWRARQRKCCKFKDSFDSHDASLFCMCVNSVGSSGHCERRWRCDLRYVCSTARRRRRYLSVVCFLSTMYLQTKRSFVDFNQRRRKTFEQSTVVCARKTSPTRRRSPKCSNAYVID
jgi:hypothetical protein